PQDCRRGVHQQRARIAADSVPGTLRAEHAGGGLVRHEDDAEGYDAGPRSGPPARRGHADHGRCQRNADSGARPGSREEGLRRRVQRDRQAIRSQGMSTAATSKTVSQAGTSKTASPIPTDKLLRLYRQMVAIRLFEERVNDLYTRALMPGLA